MRVILKTVLTALVLCCMQASTLRAQEGAVPDAIERAALMAFYENMNGANWSVGARWTPSRITSYPDSVQYLSGVATANGDIVSISLSMVGFSGTLPAELNNLTELRKLQLGYGTISGTLPYLGGLSNLEQLFMTSCGISGTAYPAWLFELKKLEWLNLAQNNFVGPLPNAIARLKDLGALDLSGNNLGMAGAIPDSLSYLDKLSGVTLVNCSLTPASVNTGLSGLAALNILLLDDNPSFVEVSGLFPDKLTACYNLQYLSVRNNGFSQFPVSLTTLPHFEAINLGNTNYADPARLSSTIDVLKQCMALRTVYLDNCQIVSLPADFDELTTVRHLVMSQNPGVDPAQCLELGYMPALWRLDIEACNLTSLPSSLTQSQSLRVLHASNNKLNPLPPVLGTIPALQRLYLDQNGITALPDWFGDSPMTSLETLSLNNNGLTALNADFGKLVNLNYLSIVSNNLNGQWPANFHQLSSMDSLYLSNNKITSLPDMTSWLQLKLIRLRNNLLQGTVPAFLTNATSQKQDVDIGVNKFNNIEPGSHYAGTAQVYLDNNRFTFEEVVPLQPAGIYGHVPQDTIVDVERETFSDNGQTATLVARADTAAALNVRYQWFKYIDGVNDSVMCPPSGAARRFTFTIATHDHGKKFYYKISHTALSLVIPSRLQTLIIRCDILPTALGFSTKQYACATNFIPVATYPEGCRTRAYSWTFGDQATSIEKSPFHAYGNAGTFQAAMKIRYSCGVCLRDTLVTKPISFNPSENLLMDSLLTVVTDEKSQVLAVSAATFADAWPLQYEASGISEEGLASGSDGVWRNEGTYVYKKPRKASEKADIAHDGTFDLDQFNWAMAEAEAIPHWIKATTMTEYSPYSYELENRDVLGVYTAALYDYGGHLPSANGVNMRHREMAFTSFEYFDSLSSGNWMFGNRALPKYSEYEVYSARSHVAIVKASQAQMENVARVDVMSRGYLNLAWFGLSRSNYIANDPIVCTLPYPNNPAWSVIVLRREPFTGVWNGKLRVRNVQAPVVKPDIDDTKGHAGSHSLYVAGQKTFLQPRLELDSGKSYLLTAWASTGNMSPLTPRLAENLAIRVVLRDKAGNIILTQDCALTGSIIDGWQQVRGVFTCPRKWAKMELTFSSGASPQAWFDDLRLHPEKGNMKTYVYDVRDYRLRAILDEENFGSFFFYDKEGNLYLTQKETEAGIKTISENVSYMTETN